LELVAGGRVRRKKEKKICRRERGTDGVCFAASEEFRQPLVMETVTKRRWLEWWWPKATVEREGEEREKNCRNKGKWLVFVRLWTRFSPLSGHEIHLYL
jgi:hypothetical protein